MFSRTRFFQFHYKRRRIYSTWREVTSWLLFWRQWMHPVIMSPIRSLEILLAMIPERSFHVVWRHVIDLYLPWSVSVASTFCIGVVSHLWILSGWFIRSCNCLEIFSWNTDKCLIRITWTSSGPGVFFRWLLLYFVLHDFCKHCSGQLPRLLLLLGY